MELFLSLRRGQEIKSIYTIKVRVLTASGVGHKNQCNMENNKTIMETLAALRYQVERYRSMKDGLMCQMLNMKIRRLENALKLSAK